MQECLWPEAKHDFVEGQHPLGLERGSEGLGQGEGQVRSPCRGLGALGASQDTDSSDTKGGFLKDRRSKSSLEISQTLRSTLG